MNKRQFLKGSCSILTGTMLSRFASAAEQQTALQAAHQTAPRTNWAGNLTFHTDTLYQPKTTEEVQHIVKSCDKLRALGRGHSLQHHRRQYPRANLSQAARLHRHRRQSPHRHRRRRRHLRQARPHHRRQGLRRPQPRLTPPRLRHRSLRHRHPRLRQQQRQPRHHRLRPRARHRRRQPPHPLPRQRPTTPLPRCSRQPRRSRRRHQNYPRPRARLPGRTSRLRKSLLHPTRTSSRRDLPQRLQRQPLHQLAKPSRQPGLGQTPPRSRRHLRRLRARVLRRHPGQTETPPRRRPRRGKLHRAIRRSRPLV